MYTFIRLRIRRKNILRATRGRVNIIRNIIKVRHCRVRVAKQPGRTKAAPVSRHRSTLITTTRIILTIRQLTARPLNSHITAINTLRISPGTTGVIPNQMRADLSIQSLSRIIVSGLIGSLEVRLMSVTGTARARVRVLPRLGITPDPTTLPVRSAVARVYRSFNLDRLSVPDHTKRSTLRVKHFASVNVVFIPDRNNFDRSRIRCADPRSYARNTGILLRALLQLSRRCH